MLGGSKRFGACGNPSISQENSMAVSSQRRPVRAAVALAGAGSLGTFLAGALREIVLAIRAHNTALIDPDADDDDPRLLHPQWGKITIDAVGGSSAGALCSGQLVKALFEPDYLGKNQDIDTIGTMTGDWIEYGCFEHLSIEGNTPIKEGNVESPGWTFPSFMGVLPSMERCSKHPYSKATRP